jgi:hypothetical protein
MKKYKDIYFTTNEPIGTILAAITASLSDGWERHEQGDRDFREIASDDAASHYFYCDKRNGRWAATVILSKTEEGKYYLSHVLPQEDSPNPFEVDQFNAIADEFHDRFLLPLEKSGRIFILNFEGEIDLEVDLGTFVFGKLKTFSAAANKSSGSSHPCDRQRWLDFMIALDQSEAEVSAPIVKQWLIEKGGWSESAAQELCLEFELGMELLKRKRG